MNNDNKSSEDSGSSQESRRQFIRKAIYASPVLLTLPASPSFAQQGSGSGSGEPSDGGDTGDGDPGAGGDCSPTDPIGGGQVQMCQLSIDPDTEELILTDIVVGDSEVADNLANGTLLGTCESFLCNAS